jgi:hypothetical protein
MGICNYKLSSEYNECKNNNLTKENNFNVKSNSIKNLDYSCCSECYLYSLERRNHPPIDYSDIIKNGNTDNLDVLKYLNSINNDNNNCNLDVINFLNSTNNDNKEYNI